MNLAFLLTLTLLSSSAPPGPPEPVNPLVGNVPTDGVGEVARIRAHLEYVIARLRAAPPQLSAAALAERNRLLDVLAAYAAQGEFPENVIYPGRRPVFIDPDGTLCAVGYLIANASGREAAEAIAARHRYDYLLDMHDPAVGAWAAEHGFTLLELAMIQPSYGWEPPEPIIQPMPPVAPPAPPQPPLAPVPPGVSPLAVPRADAFLILETSLWWQAPDGDVWTQNKAAGQRIIMRIDQDRRVTGIATSVRLRTSGKTTGRYTWTAFYPSGEILAKGALQDGQPMGRWTFYRPDGSVQLRAHYARGTWQ